MITETDHHHLNLKRPHVICDRPLDRTGKQLKDPLPQCNHTMLIIGKPRSGKSSFAWSLLCTKGEAYHRLYHKVFLVIPPSSLSSIKIKEVKQHKRIFPELSLEVLEEIDEQTEEIVCAMNAKARAHSYSDTVRLWLARPYNGIRLVLKYTHATYRYR